jgi:hypothetical protein
MRAPILCLKNRQMRRRLAGDAVCHWKSADARDRAQRDREMSRRRRFSANCFMVWAIGSERWPTSLSFECKHTDEMHHFCGSRIATSNGRIPSPPSPVHTFFAHLRHGATAVTESVPSISLDLANS